MFYYRLRLTTNNLPQFNKFLQLYTVKYLWCKEDWDTHPHIHCFFHTLKTGQCMRKYIRLNFGRGNETYKLSAVEEEYPVELLAYYLKQSDYKSEGIPAAILDEAIQYDLKVKEEFKERKAKKASLFERIENEYLNSEEYHDMNDYDINPQRVAGFVINWYLSQGSLVRRHQILAVTDTLMCRHHSYTATLAHQLTKFM